MGAKNAAKLKQVQEPDSLAMTPDIHHRLNMLEEGTFQLIPLPAHRTRTPVVPGACGHHIYVRSLNLQQSRQQKQHDLVFTLKTTVKT